SALIMLVLLLVLSAGAQDFIDGYFAYREGDFAMALRGADRLFDTRRSSGCATVTASESTCTMSRI
ncbi:MAG: hypothetical protein O7A62_07365, partial [Alphaproteobacteria bacterium]|nr:hypothetical protein [Alphaproteobacteria bacterium]